MILAKQHVSLQEQCNREGERDIMRIREVKEGATRDTAAVDGMGMGWDEEWVAAESKYLII